MKDLEEVLCSLLFNAVLSFVHVRSFSVMFGHLFICTSELCSKIVFYLKKSFKTVL